MFLINCLFPPLRNIINYCVRTLVFFSVFSVLFITSIFFLLFIFYFDIQCNVNFIFAFFVFVFFIRFFITNFSRFFNFFLFFTATFILRLRDFIYYVDFRKYFFDMWKHDISLERLFSKYL